MHNMCIAGQAHVQHFQNITTILPRADHAPAPLATQSFRQCQGCCTCEGPSAPSQGFGHHIGAQATTARHNCRSGRKRTKHSLNYTRWNTAIATSAIACCHGPMANQAEHQCLQVCCLAKLSTNSAGQVAVLGRCQLYAPKHTMISALPGISCS